MQSSFNFIKEVKRIFEKLSLKPVVIDPALGHIEVAGGRITTEVFQTEKISKAIFSAIEIDSMSVCEQSVIMWPEDRYDIPIFWCNLTQMPGMSFHIFDLIPVMDIVVWPQYAEKYIAGLRDIKSRAIEILGDGVAEKNFDLTSVVSWAFSPGRILFKLTDEGVSRLGPVLWEYGSVYMDFQEKSVPVVHAEEREFARRKREAVRKLMKENDPGYPLMAGLFGEERTARIFDIVF